MSNIKEIQKDANDSNISVSTLLRKAKLIASELKQEDFLSWINKELSGYSASDKVPEYRIVKGIPQGFNPYRGWVPYIHHDTKSQEIISKRGVGQSVDQLEEILRSNKSSLEMKYPPDIAAILREGIQMEVDLRLVIDRAEIVGILAHIRNAIFDWSIELQKAGIPDGSSDFTEEQILEAEGIQPKYEIRHIENFSGNIGDQNKIESGGGVLTPRESLLDRIIWYIVVALTVLILGNIISALILKKFFSA